MAPNVQCIAGVVATVCAVVQVIFQAAIALGLPLGQASWGGGESQLPTGLRVVSAVASVVYAFFVSALVQASGLPMVTASCYSDGLVRGVLWFLVIFLCLETILNWASPSPTERYIWGPFLLVFDASCIVLLHQWRKISTSDAQGSPTEESALV